MAEVTGATIAGYLIVEDFTDVESDANPAPYGSIFVHVEPKAGTSGSINVGPLSSTVLATLTTGPCTIVIEQP